MVTLVKQNSTRTKLTLHNEAEDMLPHHHPKNDVKKLPNQSNDDLVGPEAAGELNDPDILKSVLTSSEQSYMSVLVEQLRDWGQDNKEVLVRLGAPLWFCFVILLVRYPSSIALFFFTTFSVLYGSLFEPFVHPNE